MRNLPRLASLFGGTLLALSLPACDTTAAATVREGTIEVAGGDSLFFRLIGTGSDTVVFLAGGPALSSAYLEAGLKGLEAGHALLFYDPRGRGRSPVARHPDSLSLEQDIADLDQLRSRFGLTRLNLVAHQWGAGLALKYSLRHPDQVARLALLSPMPHKTLFVFELTTLPNDTVALAAHMNARIAHLDSLNPLAYCQEYWGMGFSPVEVTDPGVVKRLAPTICDAPPERLRAREGIRTTLYKSLGAWSWVDSIPHLAQRSLVIVGNGDPALVAGGRAWAGRLHNGRMLIAGETGLFPWLEGQGPIVSAIDRLLHDRWPDGSIVVEAPPDTVTHP